MAVALDEEGVGDAEWLRKRQANGAVARDDAVRPCRRRRGVELWRHLAQRVIQRVEGVAELDARDITRDEQPWLQRVRIGGDEVVGDVFVAQSRVGRALVLDVAADHHVPAVEGDRSASGRDLQTIDIGEAAALDPDQFRLPTGGRDADVDATRAAGDREEGQRRRRERHRALAQGCRDGIEAAGGVRAPGHAVGVDHRFEQRRVDRRPR
ncbi:MAG: hypothetical protein FJ301_01845 [Planctomycetes bacterium]|nr:hypothetical protein [Planctomycetota bacterium]